MRRNELAARSAALASPVPLGTPHAGKPHRQRFSHWYESIIDWLIANPGGSIRDCAKALGRGESTVYIVTTSSLFKARYAERRREHAALLSSSLIETQENLAFDVLSELHTRVRENPAKISTQLLTEIANSTLQRLGYGAPQTAPQAAPVTVNIDARVMEEARALARSHQAHLIEQDGHEKKERLLEPRSDGSLREPDLLEMSREARRSGS